MADAHKLPFDPAKEEAELAAIHEREEEDVARILSEKYHMLYTDLALKAVNVDALRLIPEDKAKAAEAAAFDVVAKKLSLALANPHNETLPALRDDLKGRGFELTEYLISHKSLEKALARYAELSLAVQSKPGVFKVPKEAFAKLTAAENSQKVLAEAFAAAAANESLERVSRILELTFAGALALRASDIHFEPEGERVRMRLRVDGLLSDTYFFDPKTYHQLNSRIKVLAGVKLNITDRAQDGRFTLDTEDKQIELRISFIPGAYAAALAL